MLGSRQAVETQEKLEKTITLTKGKLGVPFDAEKIDIIEIEYKIKDKKAKTFGLLYEIMKTEEREVYLKNGALMIAMPTRTYAFQLSEMKEILTVNDSVSIEWHKDEKPNEWKYEQYNIVKLKHGYSAKPYHILILEHDGEEYGIYFPCYELPVFERLTGLRA